MGLKHLFSFIGRQDVECLPVLGHGTPCDFNATSSLKDFGDLQVCIGCSGIFVLHHLLDHIFDAFGGDRSTFTLVNTASEEILQFKYALGCMYKFIGGDATDG